MRESPIYQEILQGGIEKGRAEGKAQGRTEILQQIAINLINTGMALEDISRVTELSMKELQILQEERGE